MEVIDVTNRPPADGESLVVVLGKFDGIHIGHQTVLQTARDYLDKGDTLAVYGFLGHPLWVLQQNTVYKDSITTESDKIQMFKRYGVGRYYQVKFTNEYARTTAEEFVYEHLSELNIKRLVIGEDFRFGREASAGTGELVELCRQIGVEVSVVPLVKKNGKKISSNKIRQSIQNGAMETALSLLGRPYTITGNVIHGEKMGRQLGFPTANLGGTDRYVIPKPGVYLGSVGIYEDGKIHQYYDALISAGYRPAVNGKGYLIEANLLSFSGDLYGKTVAVSFLRFLREETDFPGLDALVEQMNQDLRDAENILKGS